MDSDRLVELAEFCSHLFADSLTDLDVGTGPILVAVLGDPDPFADPTGEIQLAYFGPVSYDTLQRDIVPCPGTVALVLHASGWAAPLPDSCDQHLPPHQMPSRHPERCRVQITMLIAAGFESVTVLRHAGSPETQVLTGDAVGRVPDALQCCWLRGMLHAA